MRLPTSLLWSLLPFTQTSLETPSSTLNFTLRHIHAHKGAKVVFKDISPAHLYAIQATQPEFETSFSLSPKIVSTYKARNQAQYFAARNENKQRAWRRRRGELVEEGEVEVDWDRWDVPGPDTSKRDTLQVLAKMTWNAYIQPDDGTWYDLGDEWGTNFPFGWEPDADGFRGHVFVSSDNSTVIISIKGTSAGVFGGGGPTVGKDKLNDNLLFSCCCARVGPTWSPVCGCYGGKYRCDEDCVQEALVDDTLFYPIGTNLYNNVTYLYPSSNIWIIGHSLGGALSSLMGVTFGAPVVTFEAPGEKMAGRRLHLPKPPALQHITHVFHTADPIPMGTCTGVLSSCAIAGYAMESRCHLGKKRLYDTITKYGWSQDVRTHRIGVIIDKLLAEDWDPDAGIEVPEEEDEEEDCDAQECYTWEYGHFANTTASYLLAQP